MPKNVKFFLEEMYCKIFTGKINNTRNGQQYRLQATTQVRTTTQITDNNTSNRQLKQQTKIQVMDNNANRQQHR